MIPVSVSKPAVSVRLPPVPLMTPLNVPDASDKVSVCAPSATNPLPDSVVIVAPDVVPEILNVPSSATPLDAAMPPVPVSTNTPPLIVVAPV